jgi:hypothetical protein
MPIDQHELQITPSVPVPGTEPGGEAAIEPAASTRAATPPFEPVGVEEGAQPAPAVSQPRESATLQFLGGVANLRVSVDPTLPNRYAARFEGPQPEVTEFGNEITIRYLGGPWTWGRMEADVRLRPDVIWTLRVRGGASRAEIDVRDVDLRAFEITGGVSRMDLELGEAHGTVPVRIHGGVSRVDISRPAAVPARVEINGGASRLSLDDQDLGAIGGPSRLQTSGFETAGDCLQIDVRGGASRLNVQSR